MDAEHAESAPPMPDDRSSLPYAGVLSRIWAAILDFIICYVLTTIVLVALVAIRSVEEYFGTIASILSVAIPWLYSAGSEASAARTTPGKRQARIIVTDAQGARISFARASLRFLGKLAVLATCGLGLLTALFDRQRRALDDFIAGTRVHDVEAIAKGGPRPLWRRALGPLILVVVIGALGKIAIDAQNDFQQRARIANLFVAVSSGLQDPYVRSYQANKRAPEIGDLPFSHPQVRAVEVDPGGALVLRLSHPDGAVLRLTPTFAENGSVTWTCRVEAKQAAWFPAKCRP